MSTTAAAFASYAQSSAATASPHEIVRMAYERIITACDRAELAERSRPGDWLQTFHDETVRAQAILVELATGLAVHHSDPEVAELSERLDSLYRYSLEQLTTSNMAKSSTPLTAVRMVIDGLRDAWVTAR
jgi:flagellar biosynthetic protein FliS